MKTQIKNQLGQIAKGVTDELLKEPKRIVESAGEQTGVVPKKQESQPQQQDQELAIAKQRDQAFARERIAEIEVELKRIRQTKAFNKQAEQRQDEGMRVEETKEKKKKFSLPSIGKKRKEIPGRLRKHSGTSELRLKE